MLATLAVGCTKGDTDTPDDTLGNGTDNGSEDVSGNASDKLQIEVLIYKYDDTYI